MTQIQTPIIDSHVHLWDTRALRYPWLNAMPSLNRPFLLEDYFSAASPTPVEGLIFVQCEVETASALQETAWIAQLAQEEPRLKGIVAWAPLEKGSAVAEDLRRLKQYQILCGIRRIIQSEPDVEFCLRPAFIEGVRMLRAFDLPFDICIDHHHMPNLLKFVERLPEIPMVLDHIGKPSIKTGEIRPWADHIRELAKFPHVWCKVSGVTTEADHRHWTLKQIRPYIEVAMEAFGLGRVMFGGDWPVSTQAIGYFQWIELLENILCGVRHQDRDCFWHGNATRFYRI